LEPAGKKEIFAEEEKPLDLFLSPFFI